LSRPSGASIHLFFTFHFSLFTVPKPLLHPLHRDVGYDVCQVETQVVVHPDGECAQGIDTVLDETSLPLSFSVGSGGFLHAKVRLSERKSKYICVFPGASTFDEAKGAGFC